jgi:hypothetical protein
MASGYAVVPKGWGRRGGAGFGPFVTRELFVRPDGTIMSWESRWHRKHPATVRGSTWWAPAAMAWWIGILFALGSICFALGSFPLYATGVGTNADNLTYFIGSIFFTTASFLQYFEVVSTDPSVERTHRRGPRSLLRVEHHRIDWWAAAIQFVGTLWFNVTTYSALVVGLGASTAHHPIWRPDALGSICFLVSSWLAWAEECHGWFAWRPSHLPWWITLVNLVGSVAFGVSAVASYVKPNGQLVSLALTNLGTFVGALCFLVGAVLLLPERTQVPAVAETAPAPSGPAPSPGVTD